MVIAWSLVPDPRLRDDLPRSQAVFDRGGRLLKLTLAADQTFRLPLEPGEVAPALVEAVLLQEDRFFGFHPGVNPYALARGAWTTYFRRGRRVGGSTITMQAARRRWRIRSNTVAGKAVQVLRALQLELKCSKRDILWYYLATMPLGGNVEGVGAGSLLYFGKEARRLTVPEAIALAVVPKSPARRGPGRHGAPPSQEVLEARRRLFALWLRRHPEDSGRSAELDGVGARNWSEVPVAPHFVEATVHGHPARDILRTTLDSELQGIVAGQVASYLAVRRRNGLRNAAVLLVDYGSMQVRAAVGSGDFFDADIHGQVNGTRAKRSPGSALKPFIYALGFDQGVVHPLSILKDAPTSFGGYDPENFDRDFVGPVSVREALVRSRNIPAVQVAVQLSCPTLRDFLAGAGVTGLREEGHYGLTLALGGAELTMEELVGLYAALGNGGEHKPIRSLLDDPPPRGKRVLTPEASALVLDILESTPRPDRGWRREWAKESLAVAWKTGTSYGSRDAWTAGLFGPYVLAVWIGNFDGEGNPAFVGVEAAAPLFFRIVDAVAATRPGLSPPGGWSPEGLERVRVCSMSGQIPGPHCANHASTWFIPGRSPIRSCEVHRSVLVDQRTGLRACRKGPDVEARVFEFWPSDILRVFARAGVRRRPPPRDDPACGMEVSAARGAPPQIASPPAGVTVMVRGRSGRVTLSAVTDADARELHWFVGERYLGRMEAGETLDWEAAPGRHVLRAVDDLGRAAAREVTVESAL